MFLKAAIYVHLVSLALWLGGLFGYVAIVWPAIMSEADGAFPRAILARIAMRTGPWIYLANVYGSVAAWPRIMLLPQRLVGREWVWFRVRMIVSLVVGLILYSVAIITT